MSSPEELARQTLKDWSSGDKTLSEGKARRVSAGSANQFQQFVTPDDGRKFTELYNVQHLQSTQPDRVSRVCISTIQRLCSMLRSLFFFVVKHGRNKANSREDRGGTSCVFNGAFGTASVARLSILS
jgi:hypothetical protein